MRTKLLKASVVLALLAIVLGMSLFFTGHCIRREFFERIRRGMTEVEVEAVLGAKSGDYDGFTVGEFPGALLPLHPNPLVVKFWASRQCGIAVIFNEYGRVTNCALGSSRPATRWGELQHRWLPVQ
jgi:hypothetical protein